MLFRSLLTGSLVLECCRLCHDRRRFVVSAETGLRAHRAHYMFHAHRTIRQCASKSVSVPNVDRGQQGTQASLSPPPDRRLAAGEGDNHRGRGRASRFTACELVFLRKSGGGDARARKALSVGWSSSRTIVRLRSSMGRISSQAAWESEAEHVAVVVRVGSPHPLTVTVASPPSAGV